MEETKSKNPIQKMTLALQLHFLVYLFNYSKSAQFRTILSLIFKKNYLCLHS